MRSVTSMQRAAESTGPGGRQLLAALLLGLAVVSCTNSGLYAVGANGPGGPDRAEFEGTVCVPLAGGDSFPVKVLFALQGGAGMDRSITGEIVSGLNDVSTQFSTSYISFAVVAHHSIATGIQGSFISVRDPALALAFSRYGQYQEAGPISHRAPLKLAQSIISGDMQVSCRGQVARTRYLIVLVMTTADDSCANPIFNAGIEMACNNFVLNPPPGSDGQAECTACELAHVTEELKDLAKQYNAGEVTVQPIYITSTPDPVARAQAAAVARAGGTELIQTTPGSVSNTLTSLNYASLQRGLKLKRLIAMNRNALSRAGRVLVDTDGDGLADEQERQIASDPLLPDSDGDGLADGVEVKMGLQPQSGCCTTGVCIPPTSTEWASCASTANMDVVKGCNFGTDQDGDRLNDCEERVLGTDACITDTDGDGISDLVELLQGTNPLIAEDLSDDDRDGLPNVGEIEAHTDPTSDDIAFRQERGYGYAVKDAEPTVDGRACYDISIYNVSLVPTAQKLSPDGTGVTIPKGMNDVYIYFQVGRENDPRGTGIGSLFVPQVRLSCKETDGGVCTGPSRKPKGIVKFTPEDFVAGY